MLGGYCFGYNSSTMPETTVYRGRRARSVEEAFQRLQQQLPRLRQRYGVHRLWIVDADLLTRPRTRPRFVVEFSDTRTSLVQFVALEQAISRALGRKVLLLERDDSTLTAADLQKMVEL